MRSSLRTNAIARIWSGDWRPVPITARIFASARAIRFVATPVAAPVRVVEAQLRSIIATGAFSLSDSRISAL
jgi:hypothetical protein